MTIHVDGSISIRDDGRGIPVDINKDSGMPGVELVLTTLHSGGKYGQGGYKFSGGTHGVGAKCVNAVTEWFEVEVSRDGKVYHMEFERGKTTKKLEVIGKSKQHRHAHHLQAGPGDFPRDDRIQGGHHHPAPARTGVSEFRPGNRFHRRAPGRRRSRRRFYYKDGVEEFVKQLNKNKEPLHPKPISFRKETNEKLDDKPIEVHVEVVLQYNDSYNDQVLCYTNTIHNPDGGTHLVRLPQRAHPRDQSIRQVEQSAEGQGPADHRRRRARRSRRRSFR